jgi:ribose transport system ATP-binding protein
VSGLAKTFAGTQVLHPLDLEISRGEIHALVGENGSGKSTLIKVLAGLYSPDAGGQIFVTGEQLPLGSPGASYALGCRFVHQDLGLIRGLSVMDNLLLNTGFPTRLGAIRLRECGRSALQDLERVGLEVDPDTLVADLSPAMMTGVAVARAIRPDRRSEARLIVFDEPTASLPRNEVRRLMEIIRAVSASGIGVLYVTHRLDEVFELASNVTVLRDGNRVTTTATAALTRSQLIKQLIGDELEAVDSVPAATTSSRDQEVLSVQNVRVGAVHDASFSLRAGELVGIAGITGSGRETVLASLFGAISREAGEVKVGAKSLAPGRPDAAVQAGVAYMPPDRKVSGAVLQHSARENLTLADLRPFTKRFSLWRTPETREVKSWFQRLSIRPANNPELPFASFSGGNQQKLLVAKWLRLRPKVFLLDEPTQGVDVGAKALLHNELINATKAGTAVVVSSTDIDELVALCQRVLVFRSGRIAAELRGGEVSIGSITRACLDSDSEDAA